MCGFLCCLCHSGGIFQSYFPLPWCQGSSEREDTKSVCLAIKKNESCNPKYVLEVEYTVGNIHHPSHRLLLGTDLLFLGNSVSLAGFWCDAIISIAAAGLDQVSVL